MKRKVLILLACMTMVSLCMIPGVHARYVTSAQSEDEARVADFDVEAAPADLEQKSLTLCSASAESASYTFTVTNRSEVATECRIYVTITDADGQTADEMQDAVELSLRTDGRTVGLCHVTGTDGNIIPGAYVSDAVPFDCAKSAEEDTQTFTLTLAQKQGQEISLTQRLAMSVEAETIQID